LPAGRKNKPDFKKKFLNPLPIVVESMKIMETIREYPLKSESSHEGVNHSPRR
jgi:hypothetical protein